MQNPQAIRSNKRRRPTQSRAHQSARALQDTFIHLLAERSYSSITIRELVALAGTGIGTFYDYYANKEDLARVCVHMRTKLMLAAMKKATASHSGQPYTNVVQALLAAHTQCHSTQQREWMAHYLLERLVSGIGAYRVMANSFFSAWHSALLASNDIDPAVHHDLHQIARTCQTILYGMFSNAHLDSTSPPDLPLLESEVHIVISSYLRASLADSRSF